MQSSSAGVQIQGNIATITTAGRYQISGNLDDGQIIVETSDDAPVEIILNGATLRSTTSAPLVIEQASSVMLVLAAGSQNSLADAATYLYPSADVDEPNAALFSRADLHISGTGSLQIEAAYNDGINSKDSLTISGGDIQVHAVDDGIRGKDYLVIDGGTLTIEAGGDGLKSDNENDSSLGYVAISNGQISITSGGDGIQAQTDLLVSGGEVQIVAGGGSQASLAADASAKGLKAAGAVIIDAGSIQIDSADDAIHADTDISMNGGIFNLASGDDAIHAEVNLGIHGGEISISRSYEGIEAQHITISDGMINVNASDDGVNAAGGEANAPQGNPPPQDNPPPQGNRPSGNMPFPIGRISDVNYTLNITGGTLIINAEGDGLDINGSITMDAGLVIVHGPTQRMNAALDYDYEFTMNGGTLVAVGSAQMALAPTENSTQYGVLLNFPSVQDAGQIIHIKDNQGASILTFVPSKAYQTLTFSSPQLMSGANYTVMLGGSVSGISQNGLYTEGQYTAGSDYTTFDVTGIITKVGEFQRWR